MGLIASPERKLGGLDVFLPYIYDYVNTFTGKSITTDIWKTHLYDYFSKNGGDEKIDALNNVDWNASMHIYTVSSETYRSIIGMVAW
jgi:leukotriene-A4 hydrolase